MPIQPADLLALAELLAARNDECSLRSATSRAYYAAYHASSLWHAGLPEPGSNTGPAGGKHQVLINQLRHPGPKVAAADRQKSKFAGMKLDVMRARRVSADYDLPAVSAPAETADQLAQVRSLLAKL